MIVLALVHRIHVSWMSRYTEDELKSTDTPYGFFYDGGCTNCKQGHRVRDFPVMFDVNFNVTRTAQYLTMLEEGGYLDSMTSELKVISVHRRVTTRGSDRRFTSSQSRPLYPSCALRISSSFDLARASERCRHHNHHHYDHLHCPTRRRCLSRLCRWSLVNRRSFRLLSTRFRLAAGP